MGSARRSRITRTALHCPLRMTILLEITGRCELRLQWKRGFRITFGRSKKSPVYRILTSDRGNVTRLQLFGLLAVTAMMVCYAFEGRSRWFILAFAGSCALGSIYGFLQGAWPFGIAEG